jgi:hypothetical protein
LQDESGNMNEAKRFLFKAHMIEGTGIFLREDSKYLDLIQDDIRE